MTSWIRATGLSGQFRPCYTAVAAAGKRADRIAARLGRKGDILLFQLRAFEQIPDLGRL